MAKANQVWGPFDRSKALKTPEMAKVLGISEGHFRRVIKDPSGPFILSVHYAPKTPGTRSWFIWDKARTVAAWSQYCSYCPVIEQVQSRLELVRSIRSAGDEDIAVSLLEAWLNGQERSQ